MTQETQAPVIELSFEASEVINQAVAITLVAAKCEGISDYLQALPEPVMAAFREFAKAMADVEASLPKIMVLPPKEATNDPS